MLTGLLKHYRSVERKKKKKNPTKTSLLGKPTYVLQIKGKRGLMVPASSLATAINIKRSIFPIQFNYSYFVISKKENQKYFFIDLD